MPLASVLYYYSVKWVKGDNVQSALLLNCKGEENANDQCKFPHQHYRWSEYTNVFALLLMTFAHTTFAQRHLPIRRLPMVTFCPW
jgi:hypothetical protein